MGQLLRCNQASGPRSILTCLSSTSRQPLVFYFFKSSHTHSPHRLTVTEVASLKILHIAKDFIVLQKVFLSNVANATGCNKWPLREKKDKSHCPNQLLLLTSE